MFRLLLASMLNLGVTPLKYVISLQKLGVGGGGGLGVGVGTN